MSDIMSRFLGLVLAFVLIFVASAATLGVSEISADRRSILNEVTNFIDEVTDSGTITERQLEDFYLAIASYGPIVDAQIMRYVRVVNPDPVNPGSTYVTYVANENIYKWNQGDVIKVSVETIGYTGIERFLMSVPGFSLSDLDFTLAGRVR